MGAGLVVARLGGGIRGVSDPVRVWSEDLTETQETDLAAVLESTARMPMGTDARAYLFVGDRSGPAIRRLDRLGQCAPTIQNISVLTRLISAEASGLDIERPMVVRLYALVESLGYVGEVRVNEGSGDLNVDLAAARIFKAARFTPALVEGIPTRVWVSFPVRFTPRAGRARGAI